MVAPIVGVALVALSVLVAVDARRRGWSYGLSRPGSPGLAPCGASEAKRFRVEA